MDGIPHSTINLEEYNGGNEFISGNMIILKLSDTKCSGNMTLELAEGIWDQSLINLQYNHCKSASLCGSKEALLLLLYC